MAAASESEDVAQHEACHPASRQGRMPAGAMPSSATATMRARADRQDPDLRNSNIRDRNDQAGSGEPIRHCIFPLSNAQLPIRSAMPA